MKILKRVIVILIIILSMFYVKAFAVTGKINIEATRLRKEQNTTSEIITNIYKGEDVEVIEDLGEWIKVKYKEYTGFVKKEYVTMKEEATKKEDSTSEVLEQNIQNETKIKAKTSIRLIPNFMAKKIEEVEEEKKITIISEMNNWIKVTDGTITGWVLKSKIIKASSEDVVKEQDEKKKEEDKNNQNKTDENKVKNEVTNTVKEDVKTNTQTNTQMESVSKKGKINVETANVRKEPSTSAKRVDFLDEGDIVVILEENSEWYKIEHGNIKGYVSKKLVTLITENAQVSSRGKSEEKRTENIEENVQTKNEVTKQEEKNTNGNEVVEFAKKFLGCSYVVGGKTPETGFDCSGFTRYVYKNFGFNLASVSYEQTNVGEEVTRENLEPGDLILFYNDEKTKIGHTGIYIGNGEFIHAANPKRGVVCDNMNTLSYYNERFVTARRIIK